MAKYQAVVIGASAGGSEALLKILPGLPVDFPIPIVVVQHLHPLQSGTSMLYRAAGSALTMKEADDKELLRPGLVYFAPPNYHLLIEDDKTLSLSVDVRVNYTRPAVDVLFESAVDAYGPSLIGVVLSGANNDGAAGLARIERRGGMVIVQDPKDAEVGYMPSSAIKATVAPLVQKASEIGETLNRLARLE